MSAPRLRLDAPWLLPLILAAAIGLHLPTQLAGFYADDYTHQLVLAGSLPLPHPTRWSLYDFGAASDWTTPAGEVESLPWWTSPSWKIRFFRPLASATLVLDHALFGSWSPGYQLTSRAWYLALLVLVHALYRSLGLGRGAALLGLALFAAANGAVLPVGWPSNRNTMIAAAFVVASVLVGARASPARLATALGLALLGCLAKESAVIALPLIALRLVTAREPGARRGAVRAALVCVAVALAYVLALAAAGFGTRSLFYATPWSDPVRYAANLAVLFTAGLQRLVAPIPLDLMLIYPRLTLPACATGAVVAAGLAVMFVRRLRSHAAALYLLGWVVLSLAVEGGAPPSDRLLLSAAIGSAGLVALFVTLTLGRAGTARRPAGRLDRGVAWGLLGTTGWLSAGFAVVQSASVAGMMREARAASIAAEVGPRGSGPREVLVLQSATALVPFALGATLAAETGDLALRVRVLQMGRRGLNWTREDERTFLIESLDEPFLTHIMEGVFLAGEPPPAEGTTWRTPLFVAEAAKVDAGELRAIRFRLNRPIHDPGLRFLADRDGRLVAVEPPAVGETIRIPRAVPKDRMSL